MTVFRVRSINFEPILKKPTSNVNLGETMCRAHVTTTLAQGRCCQYSNYLQMQLESHMFCDKNNHLVLTSFNK